MTTPVLRWLQRAVPSTFLAAVLVISYLHLVAEKNIRGSIPADSDSLAYQNSALQDLSLWQKGQLTPHRFFFGEGPIHFLPPVHRWTLTLGYLVFGINNLTPYLVSAFWLGLAALGLFLTVRQICDDGQFAVASGVLLLGLPAALNYGFMGSRNDWPVTSLCLLGFYFLSSSDLFVDRGRVVLGSLLLGLAFLTKSSVAGYLALPALFLMGLVVYQRRSPGRAQLMNLACGMLVILVVAGWFYATCYRDILHYYSFWATTNQANVRVQYQLDSSWAGHLFYPRNLVSQLGSVVLAISIAGLAGLTRAWHRASLLPPHIRLMLAWAFCFVVGPYVILIARKSYASPADINMLPFLLLLALSGLWFSLGSMTGRTLLTQTILLAALGLNLVSLAKHHRMKVYQGIDPSSTTGQILDLLATHGYFRFQLFTLHQDIYFNAASVLNLALSDSLLRRRFDVSLPSYSLEERSSPKLSAEERYAALAEGADVLLVSDRPKGMQWITINQQWQELRSLVKRDPRFVLLGQVAAYDDGTALEVYGKETVLLETTGDGWLLNGAHLRVVAQPGTRGISIQGNPIAERAKDLRLVCDDGNVFHSIPSGDDRWRTFDLRVSLRTMSTRCRVESSTPAVPRQLADSSDARELLLSAPRAKVLRSTESN